MLKVFITRKTLLSGLSWQLRLRGVIIAVALLGVLTGPLHADVMLYTQESEAGGINQEPFDQQPSATINIPHHVSEVRLNADAVCIHRGPPFDLPGDPVVCMTHQRFGHNDSFVGVMLPPGEYHLVPHVEASGGIQELAQAWVTLTPGPYPGTLPDRLILSGLEVASDLDQYQMVRLLAPYRIVAERTIYNVEQYGINTGVRYLGTVATDVSGAILSADVRQGETLRDRIIGPGLYSLNILRTNHYTAGQVQLELALVRGIARCPDPALTGQTHSFDAARLQTPQVLNVTAVGMTDLYDCDPSASYVGYVNAAPDLTLTLSGLTGRTVTFAVDSSCDPTLLLQDANGAWHFNDDTSGLQPGLTLQGADTEGTVQVWVGNYYDDESCPGTLSISASGGAIQPPSTSLVNGSFDAQPAGDFTTLRGNDLTGWTITRGTIDLVGAYWLAADGPNSVDLSGTPGSGRIAQTVATQPGQTYRLSFDYAGNPACGASVKELRVSAGGQSQALSFDVSGTSLAAMGWRSHSMAFTASGPATEISFEDIGGEEYCGPAIDNVVLR